MFGATAASEMRSLSGSSDLPQYRAVLCQQRDLQRHLTRGMSRAAQTWIIAADSSLDTIEHRLRNIIAANVVAGDLGDRLVHRQIILARRNGEVDLLHQPIPVHFVVVEQRASRRLADSDAPELVDT